MFVSITGVIAGFTALRLHSFGRNMKQPKTCSGYYITKDILSSLLEDRRAALVLPTKLEFYIMMQSSEINTASFCLGNIITALRPHSETTFSFAHSSTNIQLWESHKVNIYRRAVILDHAGLFRCSFYSVDFLYAAGVTWCEVWSSYFTWIHFNFAVFQKCGSKEKDVERWPFKVKQFLLKSTQVSCSSTTEWCSLLDSFVLLILEVREGKTIQYFTVKSKDLKNKYNLLIISQPTTDIEYKDWYLLVN